GRRRAERAGGPEGDRRGGAVVAGVGPGLSPAWWSCLASCMAGPACRRLAVDAAAEVHNLRLVADRAMSRKMSIVGMLILRFAGAGEASRRLSSRERPARS